MLNPPKVITRHCLADIADNRIISIITRPSENSELRGSEVYRVESMRLKAEHPRAPEPPPVKMLLMVKLNGLTVSSIGNPSMRYLGAQSLADFKGGRPIDPENIGFIVQDLHLVMELASGKPFCSYGPAREIRIS